MTEEQPSLGLSAPKCIRHHTLVSAMRKLSIGRPFDAERGRFGPLPGEEG